MLVEPGIDRTRFGQHETPSVASVRFLPRERYAAGAISIVSAASSMPAGAPCAMRVRVRNESEALWPAKDPHYPVVVRCRMYEGGKKNVPTVVTTSPLPHDLPSGGDALVPILLHVPARGECKILRIDVTQHGILQFDGTTTSRMPKAFVIRPNSAARRTSTSSYRPNICLSMPAGVCVTYAISEASAPKRRVQPLNQVDQPPAHHAVDRRDRATLDHRGELAPLRLVQRRRLARRLAVHQRTRPLAVEAQRPIANRLQADPGQRFAASPRELPS